MDVVDPDQVDPGLSGRTRCVDHEFNVDDAADARDCLVNLGPVHRPANRPVVVEAYEWVEELVEASLTAASRLSTACFSAISMTADVDGDVRRCHDYLIDK